MQNPPLPALAALFTSPTTTFLTCSSTSKTPPSLHEYTVSEQSSVHSEVLFYHYNTHKDKDYNWGCAYRCLQMIMSNIAYRIDPELHPILLKLDSISPVSQFPKELENAISSPTKREQYLRITSLMPSIKEIQADLAAVGNIQEKEIGSRRWIEPPNAAVYLRKCCNSAFRKASLASNNASIADPASTSLSTSTLVSFLSSAFSFSSTDSASCTTTSTSALMDSFPTTNVYGFETVEYSYYNPNYSSTFSSPESKQIEYHVNDVPRLKKGEIKVIADPDELYNLVFNHFKYVGTPVMIDDSIQAFILCGARTITLASNSSASSPTSSPYYTTVTATSPPQQVFQVLRFDPHMKEEVSFDQYEELVREKKDTNDVDTGIYVQWLSMGVAFKSQRYMILFPQMSNISP